MLSVLNTQNILWLAQTMFILGPSKPIFKVVWVCNPSATRFLVMTQCIILYIMYIQYVKFLWSTYQNLLHCAYVFPVLVDLGFCNIKIGHNPLSVPYLNLANSTFCFCKCCVSFHISPRVCFTVLEWADRNHTVDIKWCFTHSHWWKWTEQSSEEQTSHKIDLIDKTRQSWHFCLVHQDPASSTTSEADSDTRENEPATLNYKPSPLHMKIGLSILPNANAVFCGIMYYYRTWWNNFFSV